MTTIFTTNLQHNKEITSKNIKIRNKMIDLSNDTIRATDMKSEEEDETEEIGPEATEAEEEAREVAEEEEISSERRDQILMETLLSIIKKIDFSLNGLSFRKQGLLSSK